jgi:hypothetical protein
MAALIFLVLNLAASLFKPRWRLEAENAALRQQVIVLQRMVRGRVEFTNSDRLLFIRLYRWFPSILSRQAATGIINSKMSLSVVSRFGTNPRPPDFINTVKPPLCRRFDFRVRRASLQDRAQQCGR